MNCVLKANDRESYAICIRGITFVPVLASVYESGTDNPMAVANRLVTTGVHGFWTHGSVDETWTWTSIENVKHEKWFLFLELSIEILKT